MDYSWWFYILLLLVAFLYASVGHGGASGYLALMALAGAAPTSMRPTALILNLFVSATAFIQYYRGGHFRWALIWPFLIASVPLAFLGGGISIDAALYKKILGIILLYPVFRFLFIKDSSFKPRGSPGLLLALGIGGSIGFLSGLIGIGGGILLSPIILLFKWADQKQTAAASALFIFVNSLSGLIAQFNKGVELHASMYILIIIAFAGGLLGSYIGSKKIGQSQLRYILVVVLTLAAFKLIIGG